MTMRCSDQTLLDVYRHMAEQRRKAVIGDILILEVVDPDLGRGCFPGETHRVDGLSYRYRSYRTWVDLAELLDCRFLTPRPVNEGFLMLRYEVLDTRASWHRNPDLADRTEKYGLQSEFSRIDKLEEPFFLVGYLESLEKVAVKKGIRILDLGVNKGDELDIFEAIVPPDLYRTLRFTGVDHATSAIAHARARFPSTHFSFLQADIRDFESWNLEPHDLLISIGTLQSPDLDGKNLFPRLVKKMLVPGAPIILGFPNARYLDGEIKYGAKMKNFTKPDLSLLVKDLFFYRRFLQKQGYRVTLTGKYYLFMTADHPRRMV